MLRARREMSRGNTDAEKLLRVRREKKSRENENEEQFVASVL